MGQRLKKYCSIKLHYKNGIAKVSLYDENTLGEFHSYERVATNLHEVFTLYKAYEYYIDKMGWRIVTACFAEIYGITIQGKSLIQVANEIILAQQKLLKEVESDEKP